MKSIKPLILTAILSVSVATASAGGIPVIDGVSNAQDAIHYAKEVVQMAKEVKQWADTIKHYSNELKQLKDTHNALSGLKKLVSYDSDVRDLVNSFEDLMSGNPDKILSRAEKYFDGLDKLCQDAKNKEMCQNASLSEIVKLDFSEKLSKKFEDEMNNIDILQQKDAPATFFTLGSKAAAYPDIIKREAKEAHEVASHTMHHQNLIRIPATAAISDINEAKSTLKSLLGHDPIYTRPPYGNTNDTVRTTVGTPIILWSVDSEDWRSKNVDSILATTMSEIHDGAIILMHDIYPTTVDAVPILIDTLRKEGYEFVTLSELTKIRDAKLENGASYYNFRP